MSLNWQDRYQTGREPERTLRQFTPDDIPAAVEIAHQIGWIHQDSDFERLLYWSPEGCFCIDEADRGIVGTVTTTSYGRELAWIGMVIVAPDRQRRGLGGQLTRAAMDYLITQHTQRIMLDATDAGRPLYERMGFRNVYKVERWEGRASTYLGPRARQMRSADLDAVFTLDRTLSGLNRQHVLQHLWDEFPALAWIDEARGEVGGYLFGREIAHGVQLGPWMSWTTAAAERLLRLAFEQLQGRQITLQIPDQNGRSLLLARNHNLKRIRYATRMIYGEAQPVKGQPLTELAVTSLATG